MAKYEIGDKVSATVKEKSKTKYRFYNGIQCGDLYDCETKIISSSFDIVGTISIRKKKTGGIEKWISGNISMKRYTYLN